MEFFIRKGSTEPILKLRLVDDGYNDKSLFNDLLENSEITFEMKDVVNDISYILNKPCYITTRTKKYNQTTDEYYIVCRFTEEETSEVGRFEGVVTIQFLDTNSLPTTKLLLPIREKLFINII
jgi:hypothetical protein